MSDGYKRIRVSSSEKYKKTKLIFKSVIPFIAKVYKA